MSKKNKTPQVQSPENYIRTRARNLEIFECLIDENWETARMASVMVARKHTNGNITYGIYLVDLLCLGVKDSTYRFNVIGSTFSETIKEREAVGNFKKIDYTLAHNIIYAAIEFAGDFGFNPHQSFTNVTQYLLEEDTDAIELIDIECGYDGKPLYFQGPKDSQTTVNRILKQLETTAGKGNYFFTRENDDLTDFSDINREALEAEDEYYDEDYDYDEDDDYEDDMEKDGMNDEDDEELEDDEDLGEDEPLMSYDEALLIFNKNVNIFETLDNVGKELYFQAVNVLFQALVDHDLYKQYYKDFYEDLNIIIEPDRIPYKALGVEIKDKTRRKKAINDISQFLDSDEGEDDVESDETNIKMLKNLKDEYGDIPILSFLEFIFTRSVDPKEAVKKLEQYINQFPDYPTFKISELARTHVSILKNNPETSIIPHHTFYPNRYRFHEIEIHEYIIYATMIAAFGNNFPRMAALFDILVDLDYPDVIFRSAFPIITLQKIKAVKLSLGLTD